MTSQTAPPMNEPVEFSVIIPTYNRLDFLKQAIGSVLAQGFKNYEIIVVDDGSADGTMDYLLLLGPGVRFLRQQNKGPGAARNLGVRHAAGRYIAFLDSDDVWFPWTLETFQRAIQNYREPSMISAATLDFQGIVPYVERDDFAAEHFSDYFETADKPADARSAALVVKRTIFDRANGFDETMYVGEDLDFYFRSGTCQDFVRVLAPATLGYRHHTGSTSTALMPLYSAAVELLIREKDGRYPGGTARQKQRWKLLSRAVRPVAFSCLSAGLGRKAWRLYRQAFVMNARLGKLRFLTGFVFYWFIGLMFGWPKSAELAGRATLQGRKIVAGDN